VDWAGGQVDWAGGQVNWADEQVSWAGGVGFPDDRWLVACQLNLLIARAGTAASVVEPGIAAEAGIAAAVVLEVVAEVGIAAADLGIAAAEVEIAAAEVGKMLGKTAEAGTAAAAGILAESSAEAAQLVFVQTAQTGQIRQSLECFQIEALAAVGPSGSQRIQTPGSAADATGQHCQLDQRQTGCRSLPHLKTGSKLFLSSAAAGQRQ